MIPNVPSDILTMNGDITFFLPKKWSQQTHKLFPIDTQKLIFVSILVFKRFQKTNDLNIPKPITHIIFSFLVRNKWIQLWKKKDFLKFKKIKEKNAKTKKKTFWKFKLETLLFSHFDVYFCFIQSFKYQRNQKIEFRIH